MFLDIISGYNLCRVDNMLISQNVAGISVGSHCELICPCYVLSGWDI